MFKLEEVVPWGRSFDEYRHMFALSEADLGLRIVACGDGPASFNALGTRRGARICSCDPLYRLKAAQIRDRIAATYDKIIEQTRRNPGQFVWNTIPSIEYLGRLRMAAMEDFLKDFPTGKREGRYIPAALPALPFPDSSFDIALCSHFLFLYSATLGKEFHVAAVMEMCRVASESRIFPLLAMDATKSEFVEPVMAAVRIAGFKASIESVPYEFQRGGNQMLRIRGAKPGKGHSLSA